MKLDRIGCFFFVCVITITSASQITLSNDLIVRVMTDALYSTTNINDLSLTYNSVYRVSKLTNRALKKWWETDAVIFMDHFCNQFQYGHDIFLNEYKFSNSCQKLKEYDVNLKLFKSGEFNENLKAFLIEYPKLSYGLGCNKSSLLDYFVGSLQGNAAKFLTCNHTQLLLVINSMINKVEIDNCYEWNRVSSTDLLRGLSREKCFDEKLYLPYVCTKVASARCDKIITFGSGANLTVYYPMRISYKIIISLWMYCQRMDHLSVEQQHLIIDVVLNELVKKQSVACSFIKNLFPYYKPNVVDIGEEGYKFWIIINNSEDLINAKLEEQSLPADFCEHGLRNNYLERLHNEEGDNYVLNLILYWNRGWVYEKIFDLREQHGNQFYYFNLGGIERYLIRSILAYRKLLLAINNFRANKHHFAEAQRKQLEDIAYKNFNIDLRDLDNPSYCGLLPLMLRVALLPSSLLFIIGSILSYAYVFRELNSPFYYSLLPLGLRVALIPSRLLFMVVGTLSYAYFLRDLQHSFYYTLLPWSILLIAGCIFSCAYLYRL